MSSTTLTPTHSSVIPTVLAVVLMFSGDRRPTPISG